MNAAGTLVYVVDDDASAREGVARLIRSAGFVARTFESGEAFLATPPANMPSCLVLDVNLPGLNGLDLQQKLAESRLRVPIVFLTGHGDIPMSVRALKAGAANFLTKPVDDEALLVAIRHCVDSWLGDQVECDRSIANIIGESTALQAILKDIQVVAPTDAAVLIQGETGTGKELVARGIHELSLRSKRAFVMVNCAAIPATLLESELFGHEKGAFTGALAQKIGRFEMAHQGTLFLDEIGEIPLELQPKLLRALQQQDFERLGATRTTHVDVRIVAATNRNLRQMVEDGKFRADLYYRLHVFPVTVPPLRDRRQDIPLLVRFFTQRYARKMNRTIEEIPAAALEALTRYSWPGNIRELQNLVERSVILSPGTVLQISVPDAVADCGSLRWTAPVTNIENPDRERILEVLRLSGGAIGGPEGAAAKLGLRRTTLQSRMKKLGIQRHFR
jgi:DNA-binding NtrC family response regulator